MMQEQLRSWARERQRIADCAGPSQEIAERECSILNNAAEKIDSLTTENAKLRDAISDALRILHEDAPRGGVAAVKTVVRAVRVLRTAIDAGKGE